jgi:hypothetical protein
MSITPQSQRANGNDKIKLGTGDKNTTTIASHGCTITDIAMAAGLPVREVNDRFIQKGVYASAVPGIFNLVNWTKIQLAIPTLEFEWRGYGYDNDRVAAAIKKNGFCLVEVDFDGTPRTDDKHWVLYIGDRKMIDPWTGTVRDTGVYSMATGFAIINKVGQPPTNGGNGMADMYTMKSGKQVDLANRDSNKVLADVYDEVMNQGVYMKKVEAEAKIIQAEKKGYENGFASGVASVPPSVPTPPNPDIPEGFEVNGVQTQEVINGVTVTKNYGKKG